MSLPVKVESIDHIIVTGKTNDNKDYAIRYTDISNSEISNDQIVIFKERLLKLLESIQFESYQEGSAWSDPEDFYLSPYTLDDDEVKESIIDYLTGKRKNVPFGEE